MARFKDVANIWSTVKELDVRDVRAEAEQPVRIAIVGTQASGRDAVVQALISGAQHFPARGAPPLDLFDAPLARENTPDLNRADVVILALDGAQPLDHDAFLTYEKLMVLGKPLAIVVLGADALPKPAANVPTPDWDSATSTIFVPSLESPKAARKQISAGIAEAIPEELRVAAARRLPGLRLPIATDLTLSVALSNATYSLSSGIPELVPVLNLPLNAADMLVLTKNQALLCYRIALAMGSNADFTTMVREIVPVIGGGFLWRQLARQLIGLVPGFGLLPKVAVAYAGTYATGVIASQWFAAGEVLSRARIKALVQEGLEQGRERARALINRRGDTADAAEQSTPSTPKEPGLVRRIGRRIRGWLPGGTTDDQSTN